MINLSKERREKMLLFLEKLKKDSSDNEYIMSINEIKDFLLKKKYGVIWEEHKEKVDFLLEENIPILTEIKDKEIKEKDTEECNFIIEGDNLASLLLLEKTHRGLIDIIYIDPPYGRGKNDFIYDDKFISQDADFKHSMWLSFMSKRLSIAYNLLSEDGVIFISIDDNEQSELKMLCDEIFGVENFIVNMPRITKRSGKSGLSFSKNHDYLLVYAKKKLDIFEMEEHIDDNFKYSDEFVEERGLYKLNQTLDYDSLSYSQSLDYPLEINGEVFYPGGSYEKYLERQSGKFSRADWAWRWSREKFEFGYKNGWIVVKEKKDGTKRIYTKTYLNANIVKQKDGTYTIDYVNRQKTLSSLEFVNNIYSNDNAKKELKGFNIEGNFDYPKPSSLIKRIIKWYYKKDAIILDFFAGTGTTGQAVLELNREDNGNRKFILCTNNQNNICEKMTYERIKKRIKGYKHKGKKETVLYERKLRYSDLKKINKILEEINRVEEINISNFDKIEKKISDGEIKLIGKDYINDVVKGIPANLKYYKIEYLLKDEICYENLFMHIKEMIQLERGEFIDNYIIILSDDDADRIEKDINKLEKCKGIYIASTVLLTQSQIKLFSKYNIKYIPDCYYFFELKEKGIVF